MSHETEIDRLNNTISQQAELIGWLKAELVHVKATLEALIKQNVEGKTSHSNIKAALQGGNPYNQRTSGG